MEDIRDDPEIDDCIALPNGRRLTVIGAAEGTVIVFDGGSGRTLRIPRDATDADGIDVASWEWVVDLWADHGAVPCPAVPTPVEA
jgi:hypothetical protein